jgi:hypothetical protein
VDHEDILVDYARTARDATQKKVLRAEDFRLQRNKKKTYLAGEGCDAGEEGCGAGVAGFELVVLGFTPESTEPDAVGLDVRRTAEIESVIEVSMKSTADHVVALESAVAAPRGPNAV